MHLLRICSGAFRTSPVARLHVDCFEPSLNFVHEELSLRFTITLYHILTILLNTYLLSTDLDVLYENRPSCIPAFGLRMRNVIKRSTFSNTNVRPQMHNSLAPWNLRGIPCLQIFNVCWIHFNRWIHNHFYFSFKII